MPSITSANAIYVLSIPALFPTAQTLTNWGVDDAFITEPQTIKELYVGIDGKLSAGLVFVPLKQVITLSADSPSNEIFEIWRQSEKNIRDVYFCTAILYIPALGVKYTLQPGVLETYPPIPDLGKTAKFRKYGLAFEDSIEAPITGAI